MNSADLLSRLSREEREAKYLKARERIFGQKDEKSGDGTPGREFRDISSTLKY